MQQLQEKIKRTIRDIPDFPKPGILFKDITPILQDPQLCQKIVDGFSQQLEHLSIDCIACVEARGFFFGTLLAQKFNIPFIPIRKKGKLPYKTLEYTYELEYGNAVVEMHEDAIPKGARVLIHDDLLATGGTAAAAAELIKPYGEIAGFSFLVDLTFLKGKDKLTPYSDSVISLVEY